MDHFCSDTIFNIYQDQDPPWSCAPDPIARTRLNGPNPTRLLNKSLNLPMVKSIKRSAFFSLAMSFFLSGATSYGQDTINDWDKMKLNGKVKSITQVLYKTSMQDGKVKKDYKAEWIEYQFNEKGFKVEEKRFEAHNGRLDERTTYTYDVGGTLIEMRRYGQDSTLQTLYTFIYDEKGNQIEENIYEEGNTLSTKYVSTFNEKGQTIELLGYNMDMDGKVFIRYTYKYDEKGNEIEEICEHDNGDSKDTHTYKYDKEGRIIEKCTYTWYEKMDESSYKETYTYDIHGNLIEETWGPIKGKAADVDIYTLDAQFNWILKTVIELKETLCITEREIEYFK